MTIRAIDESQTKSARVVGLAYLLAIVPAVFAEFYVSSQLMVNGNAAQTALNIMAHERLFRLGIASNLAVFVVDVVLITALYVVLKPVHRNLALLAAFWGLIETATLVVVTLSDLDVLAVLSGAHYLRVFETDRLQALALLSIGAHHRRVQCWLGVFRTSRHRLLLFVAQVRLYPESLGRLGSVFVIPALDLHVCLHHFSRALEGRDRSVLRRSYLCFRTNNGLLASA